MCIASTKEADAHQCYTLDSRDSNKRGGKSCEWKQNSKDENTIIKKDLKVLTCVQPFRRHRSTNTQKCLKVDTINPRTELYTSVPCSPFLNFEYKHLKSGGSSHCYANININSAHRWDNPFKSGHKKTVGFKDLQFFLTWFLKTTFK